MKSPRTGVVVISATLWLVAGCGSTQSPGPAGGATAQTSAAAGSSMAPGHTMAPGETMAPEHSMTPGTTMAPSPVAQEKAPEEALMVCGPEIQDSIKTILRLPSNPPGASTWKDQLFECTYVLDAGNLVLRVKESADGAAARTYFDSRRVAAKSASNLKGIASLGLPAYQTSSGIASFVKDNMTLEVDATGLTPTVGAEGTTRVQFAYTIATNVLTCWKEH